MRLEFAADPLPPGAIASPGAVAESDSRAALRPARILMVEDDYIVALELEHRLTEAGFDVVGVAGTAEEAVDLARDERPELAIMDIRLAGPRDGVDAAIDLLAMGVACLFATAHGDEQTRWRAAAAKPLGWLQKPYSSQALIEAVNQALATKGEGAS